MQARPGQVQRIITHQCRHNGAWQRDTHPPLPCVRACVIGLCRRPGGCTVLQEDVVRPYSCLPWAWDEHTAPKRVLVSLQGRRKLGEFELDEVGLMYAWHV